MHRGLDHQGMGYPPWGQKQSAAAETIDQLAGWASCSLDRFFVI